MPGEFKIKNGLLVDQGGAQITGSLYVTGGLAIYASASVFPTSSTILSVDGASGRLFQIDDTLSGSLYSVNTIAGLPVLEVFSDNTVRIGQYGKKALFVSQSRVGFGKESALNGDIDVSGSAIITGSLNVTGSLSVLGTVLSNVADFGFYTARKNNHLTQNAYFDGISWRSYGTLASLGSAVLFQTQGEVGNALAVLTDSSITAANEVLSFNTIFTIGTNGNVTISGSTHNVTGSLNVLGNISASNLFTKFSKSFAIINNTGIQASDTGSFTVFKAQIPCTASFVAGYRDTGSGAVINAAKNGLDLLSSNLSVTTASGWISSSVNQNANFNIGDSLAVKLINFTGSITEITIQVDFTL